MRALVTGASGFVGTHLVRHLRECGDEVLGVDRECDVTDSSALGAVMRRARPQAIYHLAALSSVAESFRNPAPFHQVNVGGTRTLLEVAGLDAPQARIIVISSADVYGVTGDDAALVESREARPVSPYAESKLAAEAEVRRAVDDGRDALIVRAFPHLGPGQGERFVVPALAARILAARREGASTIAVGDLSVRRDYTDVRDVVRAYRLLMERAATGEIYNVASGHDVALADIARQLAELAGITVDFVVDPTLLRPTEVPVLRADIAKLREATRWRPRVTLRESLADVIREIDAGDPGAGTGTRPKFGGTAH